MRALSGVFQKVCEDAGAAFLGCFSFVGRANGLQLLFDQCLDRLIEPRVRRLSLSQFSSWDALIRVFLDSRVEEDGCIVCMHRLHVFPRV